jgi:uncharacterized protein (TIGR02284 family)
MTEHEHEKMADVHEVLHSLIEVLHDGHKGMVEIGEHLKDEAAKLFFLRESQVRAEFAAELENELHHQGEHDVKVGGTAAGAVHRVWGDLKAHLGGGDHTLLETAEQGEDAAKKAYEKALEQKLPGDIRDTLLTQQKHILLAHNTVRTLRDSKAA